MEFQSSRFENKIINTFKLIFQVMSKMSFTLTRILKNISLYIDKKMFGDNVYTCE
jgi:hypothetical protein